MRRNPYRELRKKLGVSAGTLVKGFSDDLDDYAPLGITRQHWHNLETGFRIPSVDLVLTIHKIHGDALEELGWELEDLFRHGRST